MFKRNITISSIIYLLICIIFCSLSFTTTSSLSFPLNSKYILTSSYGYRDFDNSFHDGIDCAALENTPVYSMYSGIVTFSGFDNSRWIYDDYSI